MKNRSSSSKNERSFNFCPSQDLFNKRNINFKSSINLALMINQISSELSFTDLITCDQYLGRIASGPFPVYWFLNKSMQITGIRQVITNPNYQDKYDLIINQMIEASRSFSTGIRFHTRGIEISNLVDENLLVTNFSLYCETKEIGFLEIIESWEAWMEEVA